MTRAWRLLLHGSAPGPWNMGVDEALLSTAAAGGGPALRLYSWSGPWLSIGYAQRLDPLRWEACRRAGVGLVRRVTGGAAVLHGADLTYALVAPAKLLPEGLAGAYACVAEGLTAGLRSLGVEAVGGAASPARRGARPFDCFADAARHELCVDGRKLVGSAQRRVGGAVLQHGSLRLAPDPEAARRAAALTSGDPTSLAEIGARVPVRALREALIEALGEAIGARWEAAELHPSERSAAARRGIAPQSGEKSRTDRDSQEASAQADRY